MAKPEREFNGAVGQKSMGTAGPEYIKKDLDKAFAMFDPNKTLPDGSQGGIGLENMKQGAVNDEVIGNREIDDTQVPTGNVGFVSTLFNWIAHMLKSILGTSWRNPPAITLPETKAHVDATFNVHGVDSSGVESKAGAQDKVNAHENKPAPHSEHETLVGAQSKADKAESNAKTYTNAHESKITGIHGVGTSEVESKSGAQAKADAAEGGAKAYTNAHESKTTGIHGVGTSSVESKAGAQTKADAALNSAKAYTDNHASQKDNPHSVTATQTGSIVSVDGVSNPGGNIDLVAGSGVDIAPDNTGKKITISAKNDSITPGSHAATHGSGGSDPVTPASIGAETPTGAQAKVDTHEAKAAPHSGHETPTGAQAKVDTHEAKAAPHSGHETPAGAQEKVNSLESKIEDGTVVAGAASGNISFQINGHASGNVSISFESDYGTRVQEVYRSVPPGKRIVLKRISWKLRPYPLDTILSLKIVGDDLVWSTSQTQGELTPNIPIDDDGLVGIYLDTNREDGEAAWGTSWWLDLSIE